MACPAARAAILVLLAGSAVTLALAPALVPASYSWVEHTTSESAAQGVERAWVARAGFVLFGIAVIALALACRRAWGAVAATAHGAFGVLMVVAAALSSRSWVDAAPYDRTEDTLHSVVASTMGFAFAAGVVTAWLARRGGGRDPLSVAAVAASVILPVAMSTWPGVQGALQRAMFLVAYAWYARAALRCPSAEMP